MSNEAQVIQALKALEERQYGNGAKVLFRDVDYNVLSFVEQIKMDLGKDPTAHYPSLIFVSISISIAISISISIYMRMKSPT